MLFPLARRARVKFNPKVYGKKQSEAIPLDILCMQLSDMTLELLKLIDKNEKSPALAMKMREVELLQQRINEQKKARI